MEEYVDQGVHGTIAFADRPAGRLLWEAAVAGRIDAVVTYTRDRLSRSVEDLARTIGALSKRGIAMAFSDDAAVDAQELASVAETLRKLSS